MSERNHPDQNQILLSQMKTLENRVQQLENIILRLLGERTKKNQNRKQEKFQVVIEGMIQKEKDKLQAIKKDNKTNGK